METELKYGGHTASPSDYDCEDGDLAISLDLWQENGALKPVLQPKTVLNCGEGNTVLCVHKTPAYTHYIIRTATGTLSYMAEGDTAATVITSVQGQYTASSLHRITTIGNMLVALTTDGMDYFLWTENAYKRLGSHMPEIELRFSLKGKPVVSDEFDIELEKKLTQDEIDKKQFSDENKRTISTQAHAKINKFIAEEGTNKGRFVFPFFVRYAYRLYDGSVTMHSAPVLMLCATGATPVIVSDKEIAKDMGTYTPARVFGVTHQLVMRGLDSSTYNRLQEWKDIISSVDIFVSAPIYTYDQNGDAEYFSGISDINYGMVCRNDDPIIVAGETDSYRYRTLTDMYNYSAHTTGMSLKSAIVIKKDEASVYDDVRNCANFYLLKSIDIKDSSLSNNTETAIEVAEDYLQSLVTRESMKDDYDSHDRLIPEYAFAYNQRLNIANLKKELFKGFSPCGVMQYADGVAYSRTDGSSGSGSSGSGSTAAPAYAKVRFYVHLRHDGTEHVFLTETASRDIIASNPLVYYYYPNNNAYKVTVEWKAPATDGGYTTHYIDLPLRKHDFLNGAYYFSGWSGANRPLPSVGVQPEVTDHDRIIIGLQNKIYTSEVNNPLYFPLLGINTVGTGKITGISSATKALSQGQYGQFPLYAFSTDGIWALEVSSTGTYSARQPVTRDVCTDSDSITQIDDAVLFVTERGIMIISGSDTKCISEEIDNRNDAVFNFTAYPGYELFTGSGDDDKMPFRMASFRVFLSGCRMIYDDASRRLIVFNPSYRYAYVYNMVTHCWAMMRSDITGYVLSYPEALAMTSGNDLADFSKRMPNATEDGASVRSQVVVTRPLKFGAPDIQKTVDTIVQRGVFRYGHVRTLLYGSRDMYRWFPVFSSKDHFLRGYSGTPYKYFRIVLVCHLTDDESLSGATVNLTHRDINKIR